MNEKRIIKTVVIEDDPLAVDIIRRINEELKEFTLDIYNVSTLEDSLSFLDNNPDVELIILDYHFHRRITGLEILQHIRAKGIKVPVIIVTNKGSEEIAVTMMKAGASDYIPRRNLTSQTLARSIKEAFERKVPLWADSVHSNRESIVLKDMAIRTSLNGVCIMNSDGVIEYVNPSFVQIWGYSKEEEIVNRKFAELLEDPAVFLRVLEELKEKKTWTGEISTRRIDGSLLELQALFSLVSDDDANIHKIMSSFIDITRIKSEEKKRQELYRGIMEVFALKAEEVGNVETAAHIRRIAAYTRLIASKLGEKEPFRNYIDEKYINDLSYASMLHDVGKWRTPNEILLKPSELTDEEWKIIKKHPYLGVEMLSPLLKDKGGEQYLRLLESVILYHHERWDGTGYPEGLKGEEIPLSARIVALADAYEALTSDRSYRKALTHKEAYEVLERDKEKFDPRIWEIFKESAEEFDRIRAEYSNGE